MMGSLSLQILAMWLGLDWLCRHAKKPPKEERRHGMVMAKASVFSECNLLFGASGVGMSRTAEFLGIEEMRPASPL